MEKAGRGSGRHDPWRAWSPDAIAIESYARMIRDIGDGDPTTRRLLERILAREEEHAQELGDLLEGLGR